MGVMLNLGCGRHILPGWTNLDPRWRKLAGADAVDWEWNVPIPVNEGDADIVLVQHP